MAGFSASGSVVKDTVEFGSVTVDDVALGLRAQLVLDIGRME